MENKIELIWKLIERANKNNKKVMIIGHVKNAFYLSHVISPTEIDIMDIPPYISIGSLTLTLEIELKDKEINMTDDGDYIIISSPDGKTTSFVIGII